MRALFLVPVIVLSSLPALAQGYGNQGMPDFQKMTPVEAARLNQAAQSDSQLRNMLDQAQKNLQDNNQPAGYMLEKTRP